MSGTLDILKNKRFTLSGCKDIGFIKINFVIIVYLLGLTDLSGKGKGRYLSLKFSYVKNLSYWRSSSQYEESEDMYGVYSDPQLHFSSSTETSTDHTNEPSLDIESMYKDSLYKDSLYSQQVNNKKKALVIKSQYRLHSTCVDRSWRFRGLQWRPTWNRLVN